MEYVHSLDQCFANCGPSITGGSRLFALGFGRRSFAKTVSDTERMKTTPIYVAAFSCRCHEAAFSADLQQKAGELVLSITSCPPVTILESNLNYCTERNVVMVSLTTDIMFLLFTCTHVWVRGILRRWLALRRQPMMWSAAAESLRNTAVCDGIYTQPRHSYSYCNAGWSSEGL
jgi:hypothetical protein